jgi:hypothetical protein
MILEQEVFVSGSINCLVAIFICFEERCGQGINLFPVVFDAQKGKWCLKLWCANAWLGSDFQCVRDHAELKDLSGLLFDASSQWEKQFMDSNLHKLVHP